MQRVSAPSSRTIAFLVVSSIITLLPTLAPAQISQPTLRTGPVALTASQQQAVQNATPAQMQALQTAFQPSLNNLKSQIGSHQAPAAPSWQSFVNGSATISTVQNPMSGSVSTIPFQDSSGNIHNLTPHLTGPAAGTFTVPMGQSASILPNATQPICCAVTDADHDGLLDSFEINVAQAFQPVYGVSSGEPNQFAFFGNYVPMTVTSTSGATPPQLYYRVSPLGLATGSDGTQLYALRIDYLTLWNADGGLVGGGATCAYSYVGLDGVIQQLSGHDLDAERSGMLVAAPAVNGGYNTDPNAYSLYTIYTAAHEGTFFDQSQYVSFLPAVPVNNHVLLALSKSKHSTYDFNPDYYPITPAWFIASYNEAALAAYEAGEIDDIEYALALSLGNDTFFGCVVERWSGQGFQPPNYQIWVGEPAYPAINVGGFINDDSAHALNLRSKLVDPIF